jgi:hypothetical protein
MSSTLKEQHFAMGRPHKFNDQEFPRIGTVKLNRDAYLRLEEECDRRKQFEAGHVPYNRVIIELIMKYLPPHSGEAENGNGAAAIAPPAIVRGRGRPPKAKPAA